jgi:hypothetical protein
LSNCGAANPEPAPQNRGAVHAARQYSSATPFPCRKEYLGGFQKRYFNYLLGFKNRVQV